MISLQFLAMAVQFVTETGRPIAAIARELESGAGALGNWVNEWKKKSPRPDKARTPVDRDHSAGTEDVIRSLRLEVRSQ